MTGGMCKDHGEFFGRDCPDCRIKQEAAAVIENACCQNGSCECDPCNTSPKCMTVTISKFDEPDKDGDVLVKGGAAAGVVKKDSGGGTTWPQADPTSSCGVCASKGKWIAFSACTIHNPSLPGEAEYAAKREVLTEAEIDLIRASYGLKPIYVKIQSAEPISWGNASPVEFEYPKYAELMQLLKEKEAMIAASERKVPLPPKTDMSWLNETTGCSVFGLPKHTGFRQRLETILNACCMENESNTPRFYSG